MRCWWCADQLAHGDIFDGPLDPVTVVHDGRPACAFHALFYIGALGGNHPVAWGRSL